MYVLRQANVFELLATDLVLYLPHHILNCKVTCLVLVTSIVMSASKHIRYLFTPRCKLSQLRFSLNYNFLYSSILCPSLFFDSWISHVFFDTYRDITVFYWHRSIFISLWWHEQYSFSGDPTFANTAVALKLLNVKIFIQITEGKVL
jgi:hypothetical protein